MGITIKAKNLADNYITQKMNDTKYTMSTSTKMRNAGFSPVSVNKNTAQIETGIYYNGRVQDVLNKTGSITFNLLDQIADEVQSDTFCKTFTTAEKVRILKTFFDIHKAIVPTITQKETKRNDDGTYSSVWTTLN
jgi:hypothetical protein